MLCQEDLINRFVKHGATRGTASNMFIDGDVLYSYGRHFPLLVRLSWGYLQNADKYSVTTSCHQRRTSIFATALIPFSALFRALKGTYSIYIDYNILPLLKEIILIEKSKARYDLLGYRSLEAKSNLISENEYRLLSEDEKNSYEPVYERRPEALVFSFKKRYFLSSMDSFRYFISELPAKVNSVEEAFQCLKPRELDEGREFHRQGEWFFQEISVKNPKRLYQKLEISFILPKQDSNAHPHIATRGKQFYNWILVSGQIRHREHKMLRLSTVKDIKIFRAMHNRAIRSWSADGRVD